MIKRNIPSIVVIIMTTMLLCPTSKAQSGSGFFVTADASSGNVWTGTGISILTGLFNSLFQTPDDYDYQYITNYDDIVNGNMHGASPLSTVNVHVSSPGVLGNQFYSSWEVLRENGNKLERKGYWRSMFGFRAIDLFHNLNANLKVGWMGRYSPIGFYARVGIRHRNLGMQLSGETDESRYMFGTFRPGLGIRVSPSNFFETGWDLTPFVEFGSNYNKVIYYTGPYNNDKSVLNNGLSYMISVGTGLPNSSSIQMGVEWFAYDLFNKDFSLGTNHPFANLSSKQYSWFIGINRNF